MLNLRNRQMLLLTALILLTCAAYWPVYRFNFVAYDDGPYVYRNPFVQHGFTSAGLRYAFTTYTMGNWNPLLWLSFFLDRALFHLHPGPMHVENVVLHLISGILLWRLLFLATGKFFRSWIVAALFLLHPMHVESVAWIAERKDVLSTSLLIGAMICYVRFTAAQTPVLTYPQEPDSAEPSPGFAPQLSTGVWKFYLAMLVLFTLSLMVKTMGVTLPAVLLLMDFWPLQRWSRTSWLRLIIEKIPLIALSVSAAIIGGIAQYHIGTTPSLDELSLNDRLANAAVCYVIYLAKLILPHHLAVYYQHPGHRPFGAAFAASALLMLITFIFARLRNPRPYLIIGWLWFVGTLVPVIGLVQIGGQAMADRYSYFPSIGLLTLFVWITADLLQQWVNPNRFPSAYRRIAVALTAVITGILTAVSARQVTYWSSVEKLFTHALDVGEESSVAHVSLAELAYARHDIPKTVAECLAALKLSNSARAYHTLGNCVIAADPNRAAGYYRSAIELSPKTVEYHVSLAAAYRLTGELDKAREEVKIALALNPDDVDAQEEMTNIQAARRR